VLRGTRLKGQWKPSEGGLTLGGCGEGEVSPCEGSLISQSHPLTE